MYQFILTPIGILLILHNLYHIMPMGDNIKTNRHKLINFKYIYIGLPTYNYSFNV